MKFTLSAGDMTVMWEDGYIDDDGIFDWIPNVPDGWDETPTGPHVEVELDDPLGAYRTIRRYMTDKTGERAEAQDEQAFMLELEAEDYGEDYDG